MDPITSTIGWLLGLYLAAGMVTMVRFLLGGAERALPEPAAITWPARILMAPGAVLLWPVLVRRWFVDGGQRREGAA
jgi:hypothetical protein